MHKKHTLKVIYNFCIKKKQNMDGASFEAFSFEEENLEHFLEKSSGKLKYFLQKRGFLVGGTHSSLATRALIAFKQKKPNITTVKWGKFVRLLEILPN